MHLFAAGFPKPVFFSKECYLQESCFTAVAKKTTHSSNCEFSMQQLPSWG